MGALVAAPAGPVQIDKSVDTPSLLSLISAVTHPILYVMLHACTDTADVLSGYETPETSQVVGWRAAHVHPVCVRQAVFVAFLWYRPPIQFTEAMLHVMLHAWIDTAGGFPRGGVKSKPHSSGMPRSARVHSVCTTGCVSGLPAKPASNTIGTADIIRHAPCLYRHC